MKASHTLWPWKILLAVILLVTAAGIYGSVKKIDYKWRWYRIPQYFYYKAEIIKYAPFDGTVSSLAEKEGKTTITVTSTKGEKQTFVVDDDTLKVSRGDDLFNGDALGSVGRWQAGPLMTGLWTTIWLSAVSSLVALLVGVLAGLARISSNYTVSKLSAIYVEFIRGTPLLVQIYIAWFFFGTVFHLSRYTAGIGALALFEGAYVAEIVRAGIQSIPRGQMEASRSLGMTVLQAMTDVILPQAFKRILPPLAGQFISLIKDSSLVFVISITELTESGRAIVSSSFATFEVWLVVAAMYLILTATLSQLVFYMERRLAVSD